MIDRQQRRELAGYTRTYDLVTELRMLRFENLTRAARLRRTSSLIFEIYARPMPHYWGPPPPWWLIRRRATAHKRVLPDFMCIGSIKSGTSDLATNLMMHPSILAPLAKEIFEVKSQKWRPYYPTAREMAEVSERTGAARTGFFTPMLTFDALPAEVRRAAPNTKVILVLRNPVRRAYSHYRWEILLGGPRATRTPEFSDYRTYVETALAEYPALPPTYCGLPFLQSGIYAPLVSRWFEHFPRKNIHVLFIEDYFADPEATLTELHRFLELPSAEYRALPKLNENPLQAPPEDPEGRKQITDFYRPHNASLAGVLGRPLNW